MDYSKLSVNWCFKRPHAIKCTPCNLQSTSLIPAPLWFERSPEAVSDIPKCSEEGYTRKVRYEQGFDFPPVMGKCVEQLVREIWMNIRNQR